MVQFKLNDVKKVGKVQISACKLKELAEKLEKVRETVDNVEVDLYLVPNKDNDVSQIAFDFSKEVVSEKVEEKPVENVEPGKGEPKIEGKLTDQVETVTEVSKEEKKEEKPVMENQETLKIESPAEQSKVESPVNPPAVEVPVENAEQAKEGLPTPTEEEIAEKAKEINENVQKGLNLEGK